MGKLRLRDWPVWVFTELRCGWCRSHPGCLTPRYVFISAAFGWSQWSPHWTYQSTEKASTKKCWGIVSKAPPSSKLKNRSPLVFLNSDDFLKMMSSSSPLSSELPFIKPVLWATSSLTHLYKKPEMRDDLYSMNSQNNCLASGADSPRPGFWRAAEPGC